MFLPLLPQEISHAHCDCGMSIYICHFVYECLPPSAHSCLFVLCLFIALSFSVGSYSSCCFTQNRGQDNNVKHLKAKLGHRKIKDQVPRPRQTIRHPRLVTTISSSNRYIEPISAFILAKSNLKSVVLPFDLPARPPCPLRSLSW